MENVTKQQFLIFSTDITNFLSQYIDISKIAKNYLSTNCILTNYKLNKIRIAPNDFLEVIVDKDCGVTTVPIVFNRFGFKLANPICYVRNMPNDPDGLKNTMFHELMHVGSISQTLISKTKLLYNTGLYSKVYNSNKNFEEEKYEFLNEAMTELTAKFIYDKLYDKKYEIITISGQEYKNSIYAKEYFLLSFLLLNYFEEHPNVLFDIYFNNKINLFKKVVADNTCMNFEQLNYKINELHNNPDNFIIDYEYKKTIRKLNRKNPLRNKDVLRQYNL